MYLTHLSLTNFRNYARLELDLPQNLIVLVGDNAQGKTNLLEAINYLAVASSPHTTADRQLVNWLAEKEPQPFARVVAQVQKGDEIDKIEIILVKRSRPGEDPDRLSKTIKVNGVTKRVMDFIGQVNVVHFAPQDLELIGGSPSVRRRYLDATLCQIDARYCRSLSRYNKVVSQRNYLLRRIQERRARPEELNFWNKELAEHGSRLIARRQEIVGVFNDRIREVHPTLTGGDERLRLFYERNLEEDGDSQLNYQLPMSLDQFPNAASTEPDREEILQTFRSQLRELQNEEVERGVTMVGPHRDDVRFLVDGIDMQLYGSRGQQRTSALSLKLAETQVMTAETGRRPILLLDDVMSELDVDRRAHLMAWLQNGLQVVITTADLDVFPTSALDEAFLLRVEGGRIHRIAPNEVDASA